MDPKRKIYGCDIKQLNSDASNKIIDNIKNKSMSADNNVWLLVWQNDGIIWGFSEKGNTSIDLSCEEFPKHSPKFNSDKLLELRLFQHDQETLIWQSDASMTGRNVIDNVGHNEEQAPFDTHFLLLGDNFQEKKKAFSLIKSRTGAINFPPVDATNTKRAGDAGKLYMKNYFEQDEDSGMLRVALTRLVSVEQGGK